MTIYTQGAFDILHKGHINLLNKCALLAGEGGFVVVGVSSDARVQQTKGRSTTMPQEDRADILRAIRCVGRVLIVEPNATVDIIRSLAPDIVVVGSDWLEKDIYKNYGMSRQELDPLLVYHPYTMGVSSTEVRKGLI